MQHRGRTNRRQDSSTAERIDLAILAARAFNLHAAQNYLRLSGVDPAIMQEFSTRYPARLRPPGRVQSSERRGNRD